MTVRTAAATRARIARSLQRRIERAIALLTENGYTVTRKDSLT